MVRKKQLPPPTGAIQKTDVRSERLAFSFRFFHYDGDLCPENHPEGYAQRLMERLRDLSSWTLAEFTEKYHQTVRNHRITWVETARPVGFAHLPAQVREADAWQFSITANEWGRVHGLLIGNVFHVIWLDFNHRLYPQQA